MGQLEDQIAERRALRNTERRMMDPPGDNPADTPDDSLESRIALRRKNRDRQRGPTITERNHIRHAGKEIDFWEGRNQKRMSAPAKQAIVDQYRVAAGMEPLLGRDHFKEAKRRINERSTASAFAAGVGEAVGGMGADVVSLVSPATGEKMREAQEAHYGPVVPGAAGRIGGLVGQAGTMIPALASGNIPLLAAQFGIAGAGGARAEVRNRRAEGLEISASQEFMHALLTGGIEAGSGYVGGRIFQVGGKAMAGLAPGASRILEQKGEAAAVKWVARKLGAVLGISGAEASEEAATQVGVNFIARLTGVDEERDLFEGVGRAATDAAILAPFLGPVANARHARHISGRVEEQGVRRALRRPPGKPVQVVAESASDYMESIGADSMPDLDYLPVDEVRAAQIAEAYDQMQHDPNDPLVRKSYDKFKRETLQQYEFLLKRGMVFDHQQADPYDDSDAMRADIEANNRLATFLTDPSQFPPDHPLLEMHDQHGITYNDMFRAVHDYFGHAHDGNGMGPRGEEHAWRRHSQMYSPTARLAMTTETRGQNSWINYGPNGEQNRASPAQTVFPDQKAGLLPPAYSLLDEVSGDEQDGPEPMGMSLRTLYPTGRALSQLTLRQQSEQIALAAERDYRAKVVRSEVLANKWRKQLSEDDLKDIGASVEGIGRVDNPGENAQSVEHRMKGKNAFQKGKVKAQYQRAIENSRQEINDYLKDTSEDEYIAFLEDYLPHFYMRPEGGRTYEQSARYLFKNAKTAEKRKLPTFEDAVNAGLVPITQDISTLYKTWINHTWRAATVRRFLYGLRTITEDGTPVVMPKNQAPDDWVSIEHPILKRTLARGDDESKTFWQVGVKVHPEVAPFVKAMTDKPLGGNFIQSIEGINAWAKKSMLSLSLFHHIALTESSNAVLAKLTNPVRGVVLVGEVDPTTMKRKVFQRPHRIGMQLLNSPAIAEDMVGAGLQVGAVETDAHRVRTEKHLDWLAEKTKNVPMLGKAVRAIRAGDRAWNRALWDRYHNGLKAFSFYDITQKAITDAQKKGVDLTEEQIQVMKEDVADFINNAYGGQEWMNTMFRNPKVQQVLQMSLLAPDWTLSNMKIAGRTIPALAKAAQGQRLTVREKAQLKYWRNMLPGLAGSAIGLQVAIFYAFGDEEKGDKAFPWENEEGHTWDIDVTPIMRQMPWRDPEDKQRQYTHFGKQAREVLGWVEDPFATIERKTSPSVQFVREQLFGIESVTRTGDAFVVPWADKEFWPSFYGRKGRAVGLLEKFVPFSFRGTNFALTAPISKGATPWKLRTAFAKELRAYADPTILRQSFDASPEYEENLLNLVVDTMEAGTRNGHDSGKLFKQALSRVRGEMYREFFEAMEDKSYKRMERSAEKIVRLHKGVRGVMRSARARNIDLDDEDLTALNATFAEAQRRLKMSESRAVPIKGTIGELFRGTSREKVLRQRPRTRVT